jgi:hypothetical protein
LALPIALLSPCDNSIALATKKSAPPKAPPIFAVDKSLWNGQGNQGHTFL